MRVICSFVLVIGVYCSFVQAAWSQQDGFVGQANGQIHNEFTNSWLDKPINVIKEKSGTVLLEVGNLTVNSNGTARYQARCRLSLEQQKTLTQYLSKALALSEKAEQRRQNKTELLGEFINGKGAEANGLRVYFFCRKRVMNPVGAVLFIRDFEDDYHIRLYLYPSQIRQLISLLTMKTYQQL